MSGRIILIIAVACLAVGFLMFTAVSETAKEVVTVAELTAEKSPRKLVRLGARVAPGEISYKTEPEFLLSFLVHDIPAGEATIAVSYQGIMPDTLKVGRDVILEGEFTGEKFIASSLLTQCPSKYEVPLPEGHS